MADRFNCTVHSFDPSMLLADHRRSKNVWFYNSGLAERNYSNERGWRLFTLKSVLDKLKMTDRNIEILKFEVEGSEFSALENMISEHSLRRVKQVMFEMHSYLTAMNAKNTVRYSNILQGLHQEGFKRYYSHENLGCEAKLGRAGSRAYCTELYYINEKFMDEDCIQ